MAEYSQLHLLRKLAKYICSVNWPSNLLEWWWGSTQLILHHTAYVANFDAYRANLLSKLCIILTQPDNWV